MSIDVHAVNAAFERLYTELSRGLGRPLTVPCYFLPGDEVRIEHLAANVDGAVRLVRELEGRVTP